MGYAACIERKGYGMRSRLLALVCIGALGSLAGGAPFAQTVGQRVYVSDELIVVLRTGPSNQNRILRNLPAGTSLEVLEVQPEVGYARVREAGQGTEGWVLTQYLTDEPIARDRLARSVASLAAAQSRIAELQSQIQALTDELAVTRQALEESQSQGAEVSSDLAEIRQASANAIALRDQNEQLRRRGIERDAQLEQLTLQNAELTARTRQDWFVIGAGVLLAGIVVGLVVPSLRRRKRTDW